MIRSPALAAARNVSARVVLSWAAVAVAAGALLAFLGPFGSYRNGGPISLAGYWISAMLLGAALYGTAYGIVRASIARGSAKWWPVLIGTTLLVSVPEALVTRTVAFWLWPKLAALPLPLTLWFAQTATIGLCSVVIVDLVLRRTESGSQEEPAPSPPASSLVGDVLALQMEDHYVRVHRPTGSELVLMPLRRAMECVEAEGLRVHRSWWVARHAVSTVEGDARSMRLHLSNGVVAPVARSAIVHLRSSGWITGTSKVGPPATGQAS